MKRGYTQSNIAISRNDQGQHPDCSIATDIIVGSLARPSNSSWKTYRVLQTSNWMSLIGALLAPPETVPPVA